MEPDFSPPAPFFREPGAGATRNVLGVTQTCKATSAETAGAFSLWEAVIPPGAGAPPHTHSREEEAFYVLSGELVIELEGEPVPRRVAPGGFFFGARGRRHAFRNADDQPARVLIFCAPGCGLDHMFCRIAGRHGERHAGDRSAGGHRRQVRRRDRAAC